MAELSESNTREFYRRVKAMRKRDESYNPKTMINDANGNPLHRSDDIRDRWEEYFKDLINPIRQDNTEAMYNPSYPENTEPDILEVEVRKAIKSSPKHKAAGVDSITTEAILACGEIGVKWLHLIFQKCWRDGTVPADWLFTTQVKVQLDTLEVSQNGSE
jgi:hypothetical protein